MTGAFEFATASRIVFGAGRAAELPAIVSGLGSRVLVCTGGSPGRHDRLLAGLGAGAAVFPVREEPTAGLVRAGVASARRHGADVVAAIGGGAVIDAGKAIAMLLGNGGAPLDYLEVIGAGKEIARPSAPLVAVPTTAGTGAEVTANAVLAVAGHGMKASLRSPLMLPRVALVDPQLTVSCPPAVTAASGLDALTQCLEPLVSIRANPVTDGLAAAGLRHAAAGLRAAHADGQNLAARTDMAVCALLGGLSLANAKLGAVHGLAGVIGGMAPVPHGMACAALLAPVTQSNLRALRSGPSGHPALGRYTQAAQILAGDPSAGIEAGLAWIRETVALLGVPSLRAFGIGPEQADEIAAKAARSSSMQGNAVPLSHDELRAIVMAAI